MLRNGGRFRSQRVAGLLRNRWPVWLGIRILPLVESQAEWDGHCEQLESHLAPAGLLETVLVEKVALQLWRLKRLALYEREVTAISLESVKETQRADDDENDDDSLAYGTVRPVAAAKQAVKRLETELSAVVSLGGRGENEAVDSGLAARLIEGVAEDLDVDIYDDNEIEFPDYPEGANLDSIEWTAGYLKTCLGVICQHGGSNFDTALAKRIAKYRVDLAKAKAQVRSLVIEADRKKRQLIVPNALELEKIVRYESHLERSLYRALHELQRLQTDRKGQVVSRPRAIVHEAQVVDN